MAMWNCNALIAMHPVIGIDMHDIIIPPAPPVAGPYVWVQILSGLLMPTVQMEPTVVSSFGFPVMQRGTDIGPLLVHVGNPVNIALPFIILGSASKSEFGAFSVLVKKKPVAIAVAKYLNFNLNCWGPMLPSPLPVPSGTVIAFNTVEVGFSIGDLVASLFALIVDMAIQGLMNVLGDKIGKAITGRFFSGTTFFPSPEFFAQARNANAVSAFVNFLNNTFLLGTPIGLSTNSDSPVPASAAGRFSSIEDEALPTMANGVNSLADYLSAEVL